MPCLGWLGGCGSRALRAGLRAVGAPLSGGLAVMLLSAASGVLAAPTPRSSINRPDKPGAVFLCGSASLGGTRDYHAFRSGWGVGLIFRPHAAAELFGPLYDWNSALVLEVAYRSISPDRDLRTGTLTLRHYVRDMRPQAMGESPFLGVGIGLTDITFPSDGAAGHAEWHTPLFETGYEVSPSPGSVFFVKGQWLVYRHAGFDYTGWSVHLGAGIPISW